MTADEPGGREHSVTSPDRRRDELVERCARAAIRAYAIGLAGMAPQPIVEREWSEHPGLWRGIARAVLTEAGRTPSSPDPGRCDDLTERHALSALRELVEFRDDGSTHPRVWRGLWAQARTVLAEAGRSPSSPAAAEGGTLAAAIDLLDELHGLFEHDDSPDMTDAWRRAEALVTAQRAHTAPPTFPDDTQEG